MISVSRRLVETLLPPSPLLRSDEKGRIASDVLAFVRQEIDQAPFHVRFGVFGLCLAFHALAYLFPVSFERCLILWDRFSGGFGRAYTRLVKSMVYLAFFEHPVVLEALGVSWVVERQRAFRRKRILALTEGGTSS